MRILSSACLGRNREERIFFKNYNFFPVCAIEGENGTGKSTLAFSIIEKLEAEHGFTAVFINCTLIESAELLFEQLFFSLRQKELIADSEFSALTHNTPRQNEIMLQTVLSREKVIIFIDDFFQIEDFAKNFGKLFFNHSLHSKLMITTSQKLKWMQQHKDKILRIKIEGIPEDDAYQFIRLLSADLPISEDSVNSVITHSLRYPHLIKVLCGSLNILEKLSMQKSGYDALTEILNSLKKQHHQLLTLLSAFRRVANRNSMSVLWQHSADIDELIQMNIIEETMEGFIFVHSSVKSFFYSGLSPEKRSEIHKKCLRYYFYELKNHAKNHIVVSETLYHLFMAEDYEGASLFFSQYFDVLYNTGLCSEILMHADRIISRTGDFRVKALKFFTCSAFKKSEDAASAIEKLCLDAQTHEDRAFMHQTAGDCHSQQHSYEKALKHYESELSLRQFLCETRTAALCMHKIAQCRIELSDYKKAEYMLKKADTGHALKELKAKIQYSLGRCAFEQRQYTKALKYMNRALEIYKEIKSPEIANIYANIAYIYCETVHFDEAVIYYQKSLALLKKNRDFPGMFSTLCSCAIVHIMQKKYKRSMEFLTQSLEIAQKTYDRPAEIFTLQHFCMLYSAAGDSRFSKVMEESKNLSRTEFPHDYVTLCLLETVHYYRCSLYETAVKAAEEVKAAAHKNHFDEEYEAGILLKILASYKMKKIPDMNPSECSSSTLFSEALKYRTLYEISGKKSDFTKFKNIFRKLSFSSKFHISSIFESRILIPREPLKKRTNSSVIVENCTCTILIKGKKYQFQQQKSLFNTFAAIASCHPQPASCEYIMNFAYQSKQVKKHVIFNNIKKLRSIIAPFEILKKHEGYCFEPHITVQTGQKNTEVSGRDFSILKLLQQRGELSNHMFQDALNVSNATVFRHMKQLIEKGLVIQAGGGRSVAYSITARGEECL